MTDRAQTLGEEIANAVSHGAGLVMGIVALPLLVITAQQRHDPWQVVAGAIYGALFIQFVPNLADDISKAAPWAIYGVFLIGFMYVMPRGIAGALRLLGRRLARATGSRPG